MHPLKVVLESIWIDCALYRGIHHWYTPLLLLLGYDGGGGHHGAGDDHGHGGTHPEHIHRGGTHKGIVEVGRVLWTGHPGGSPRGCS